MDVEEIRPGENVESVKDYILKEAGEEAIAANMESASKVLSFLPSPSETEGEATGLILGRVQAGKTMAMVSTISLAADTGYRFFIVLTSDNVWLRNQTYERLAGALPGLHFPDRGQLASLPKEEVKNRGAVIVCTKNASNLRNLLEELDETDLHDLPAIIIDDEADQASLNTNARTNMDPSTINTLISAIRNRFGLSVFLQVTATPNALLLQPSSHDFRPEFVVVLEPGAAYVGGQILFSEAGPYIREVNLQELLNFLTLQAGMPHGLKRAVCTFLIAATLKYMFNSGRAFFFLCHVSHLKQHHDLVGQAIESYLNELSAALINPDAHPQIIAELRQSYDDLSDTVLEPPAFELVLRKLRQNAPSRDIQVLNADSEVFSPRDNRIYNFLIGGNRLGRGVTIKRLLVTYYGRNTQQPQMDTVQQHARMYGYRRPDLDVIRIFLPRDIAERFRFLDEADTALRELIKTGKYTGIEPVMVGQGMRATRANVLAGMIGFYVAGTAYSPQFPEYRPEVIGALTPRLDDLLSEFNPTDDPNAPAVRISIDMLIRILSMTRSEAGLGGSWEDSRILSALESIKDRFGNSAYVIVRRNRELNKPSGRLRDPSSHQDRVHRNGNYPTVWMYRQNGTGWAGVPFWIPRIHFPDGNYAITFNLD